MAKRIQGRNRGFSIMELSVVLVVIGLLVGGLLTGQSMIRTSQMRDVISDVEKFASAVNGFSSKYKGLPGDMVNATEFWGKDTAVCNAQPGLAGTPGTCNGDGNGQIGLNGTIPEMLRAWQQLQLAGMIDGSYSGVAGAGGSWHHVIGANAPKSRYEGGGYSIYFQPIIDPLTPHGTLYDGNYGHVIVFGAQSGTGAEATLNTATSANAAGPPSNPVLSAEDAYYIDGKMDDGNPKTGTVLATKPAGGASLIPNCTTATPAYNLSNALKTCVLIFVQEF